MAFENAFLQWVVGRQKTSETVLLPARDDMAVLHFDADDLVLVGIDQVLDGVHFRLADCGPAAAGRKAMNRNLSDCAAMACLPAAAVVSVALPRGTPLEIAQALYAGVADAGAAFDCPIVGGDTGVWDAPLAVTVTVLGRSAGINPLRRSGARPGDALYVTGPLGGSIFGRHLAFTPRVREARELVRRHRISAMMDLSDGLATDLPRLCRESGVGAEIYADLVPVHVDVVRHADDLPPLQHALADGEDHELLFAGEPDITTACAVRIGTIIAEPGVWIEAAGMRAPLTIQGFEHGA